MEKCAKETFIVLPNCNLGRVIEDSNAIDSILHAFSISAVLHTASHARHAKSPFFASARSRTRFIPLVTIQPLPCSSRSFMSMGIRLPSRSYACCHFQPSLMRSARNINRHSLSPLSAREVPVAAEVVDLQCVPAGCQRSKCFDIPLQCPMPGSSAP
jgi:hypothetical protein